MRFRIPSPGRWPLAGQLAALAIVMTLLSWMAGMAVTTLQAQRAIDARQDQVLVQVAHLMLGLAGHELDEFGPDATLSDRIAHAIFDGRTVFGDNYRYQIWNLDGQLLLSNFGLASAAAMAPLHADGFSDLHMDGADWRVYTLRSIEEAKIIQVAEHVSLRSALPMMMDASMGGIVALSLMVVLWPTLRLVRRLVRPLEELAAQFVRRHPLNLSPVSLSQASRDLDPVVDAVNDLFGRAERAMQTERGFTAMAAHELRTPLATLRALCELLAQTDDEAERRRLIADVAATSDRCTHLQDQLLTLARLDLVEGGGMQDRLLLADVVTEVQEELLPEARLRQVRLAARLDDTEIMAHRFGVRTLVRNLVSNGMRHTPPGGRVEIRTFAEGRDAIIEVHDSGAGIPEPERQRVFERFVRLSPHQGNGVGLGLSIVRTVADAHQAEVRLGQSPLGGLSATVRFPGRCLAVADAAARPA